MIPATGAWKGERCFLVGGGESKYVREAGEGVGRYENLRRIERFPVIACNVAAFEVAASIALVMDRRVLDRWSEAWRSLAQTGTTILYPQAAEIDRTIPDFVEQVRITNRHNWSERFEDGICWHSDAGLTALSVACIMGADPIYLVGIDMKPTKDRLTTNAGGLYPKDWQTSDEAYDRMIEAWQSHAAEARRGREVVNLNPESGIRCFPFGAWEEACR